MKNKQFEGFYREILRDSRIEKRAEKIMVDMLDFGNVVVNKFYATSTEKTGAYRMLGNDSIDHNDLARGVYRACKSNDRAAHLLGIQDTSEINFSHHIGRITDDEDIGPVTKSNNAGFFCHPMLVIDTDHQLPIGISSIDIWNRSWDKANKYERDYHNQNIEDKESYRWITSAEETKKLLTKATCLTIIGDRESDIYDEFVTVPDNRTQLETGGGLKKLAVIALQVALSTMTLKLSLSNTHKVNANIIFSKEQLHFLTIYMEKLEGKTEKLKNPYEKGSLQWATWAMGRLGGWSGYQSQGPPGYISIKDGTDRFYDKADGFQMALKYLKRKDVYKG